MASTSKDQAPWQQADTSAELPGDASGATPDDSAAIAPEGGPSEAADGSREEPVWTGLLPAVAARPAEERPSARPGTGSSGVRAVGAPEDSSPVATAGAPQEGTETDEQARRRAARRQDAVADEPRLPRLQQVFLAVVLPLALLAAAVRIVATPLFLWVEYHRPGFPADSYGFLPEERMTFGSYGLDYVLNWAPPGFLGRVRGPEGDLLFLPAEVAHMTDVKIVLQAALAAVAVLALLGLVSALYLRAKAPGAASGALFFGSWLTVVLLVALAVAAVLGWQQFFALFHSLFFAEGTWTFRSSDALIRLYPTQFWVDAALSVGILTLVGALAVMALTWPTAFRRERARDRVRRRQEIEQRLAGR